MAGIEIKGFEELRRNTERLQRTIAEEAIVAAENAAAAVIKRAVEAAAITQDRVIRRILEHLKNRAAKTRGPPTQELLPAPEPVSP